MKKVVLAAAISTGLVLSVGTTAAKAPEPDWVPLDQDDFISLVEIPDSPDPTQPLPINWEPPVPVIKQTPKASVPPYKPSPRPVNIKVGSQRSIAKNYALDRLGAVQFSCLNEIWSRESHWNYTAENKSSGAYGIPQALPGSKMASFGADWKTNPITQVKWGIHYVNGRYGSACGAWEFWQSNHWY